MQGRVFVRLRRSGLEQFNKAEPPLARAWAGVRPGREKGRKGRTGRKREATRDGGAIVGACDRRRPGAWRWGRRCKRVPVRRCGSGSSSNRARAHGGCGSTSGYRTWRVRRGALLLRPLAGEASAHFVEFELVLGVGFGLGGGVLFGLLGVNGGLLEGEECLLRGHSSKQGCLNLHSAGGGVGEHKASAKTEGGAGGFEGVSAGRHVVHEIGLTESQGPARAGEVVLIGRGFIAAPVGRLPPHPTPRINASYRSVTAGGPP